MGCGLSWVDHTLARLFYKLGVQIGHSPGYFLVVPVLLAGLCVTGYQQIRYEIDPEYLFSPIAGEGKHERAIVEHFFPINYSSRFNLGRITRPGRFGRVIVIAKDGGNMLRKEIWREMRKLDQIIQNVTAEVEGEEFSYREICAKWVDECVENDILNLDYLLDDVENNKLNLTFPIMLNPVTWDAHTFPVFFGGTVVSPEGIIIEVPSVQLVYFVTSDNKRQDTRGAAWEQGFLDAVGDAEDSGVFQYISTARFASRTLDIELERNTRTVIPFFSTTFIIMVVFSVTSCMMFDWVRAKPWLGVLGTLSAVMGTAAAFGIVIYCRVEFIGINLAAPFLMLGIGIDDTFVMLAAWRRTSVHLEVPERMGQMMSEAAVSITITSLTDMLSFWIGVISPFPSVRIFCIYTGFAVWFTFMWHITFFSACVALSGFAEKKNLHSLVCCKTTPKSEAGNRSLLYRMFCTGGISKNDPYNPKDNKDHAMMVFFRDKMAPALTIPAVKVVVIAVFIAYLAGACWGITTMKEGLERRKLSREDSYSVQFYDREDFYFREFPYRIQVVINGDMDYSDPKVQAQIEDLTQTFENTSYISSPLYTESWIRSFLGYVKRNQDYLNINIDTEEEFINSLNELYLFTPNPFTLDVKFNENKTRIVASRFLIQAVNITDGNHEKEMVTDLRKICEESSLNVTVFHPYFVFFDQFQLVRPTSIQCMIIAAGVMMMIALIFIPNILCCFWIAFSIISIEAGVAGYMALWNVNLDSISMINLIMCIGFSVDFSAHICYAYMSAKVKNPEDRIRECLYGLGLPIIQGALSTIVGVAALSFAKSYIFLTFFKTVFLVIFFGAMHGLFLLPVLLSLFGPGSCSSKDEEKPSEKPYSHPYCIPHPTLQAINHIRNNGDAKSSPSILPNLQALHVQSLKPGHYISSAVVPPPSLPPHMVSYGSKYDGSGDRNSLEKDLGIGTSGEESSESSSNKSQRQKGNEENAWRKKPRSFQPPHIMEVYNNSGYVSDEEHRDRSKLDYRWSRSRERENRDNALSQSAPPNNMRRYSSPPENHRRSKSHGHRHSGYIGEMKFP